MGGSHITGGNEVKLFIRHGCAGGLSVQDVAAVPADERNICFGSEHVWTKIPFVVLMNTEKYFMILLKQLKRLKQAV